MSFTLPEAAMGVQPARGRRLSGAVSALTFTGECLPRRCCKTFVCVCVSRVDRRHLHFLSPHISTQQLSETRERRRKKKSILLRYTVGTACLRPGEGQSGRSVYSRWPQLAGRVWTVAAPHGRLRRCCLHLAFWKAWASLPGCSFYRWTVV